MFAFYNEMPRFVGCGVQLELGFSHIGFDSWLESLKNNFGASSIKSVFGYRAYEPTPPLLSPNLKNFLK